MSANSAIHCIRRLSLFPLLLNLGWTCDLCWPIEFGRSDAVLLSRLAGEICIFCFLFLELTLLEPSYHAGSLSFLGLILLWEGQSWPRGECRTKYGSSVASHTGVESSQTFWPSDTAECSQVDDPSQWYVDLNNQLAKIPAQIPNSQNHEQVNWLSH